MADPLRDEAERFMRTGVSELCGAFNLANAHGRAWRFDPDVQARAEELLRELGVLFFGSEIRAALELAKSPWSDPRLREVRGELERNMRWIEARGDKTFQSWLVKVESGRRRARR